MQLAQVWSPSHVLLGSRLLWAARRLGVGFVAVAAMKEASRTVLLVSLPLVAGLSLGLMRPGKGVMIALQMRNRSGQSRHDS